MTTGTLSLLMVILWTIFAAITFSLHQDQVFVILDAMAISAGIAVTVVYWSALVDAWKNRDNHLTPAHLLTLGICSNWLGLVMRLGRWYVTNEHPINGNKEPLAHWFYNLGLWISLSAAFLLIGAVATTDPDWTSTKTLRVTALFIAITVLLMIIDVWF